MIQNSNQPAGSHSILLKKLTYASWHRGTREMDLILGRFADEFLNDFSSDQLQTYAGMLDYPDAEIFDWIRTQTTPPKIFDFIIDRIRIFYSV